MNCPHVTAEAGIPDRSLGEQSSNHYACPKRRVLNLPPPTTDHMQDLSASYPGKISDHTRLPGWLLVSASLIRTGKVLEEIWGTT